uniref:Methyltransferase type 11 domain-containing protein n=1 Tax=Leptocylindrus danicus TaxID=163516 RepID=A0A7S2LUZ0_9STRA
MGWDNFYKSDCVDSVFEWHSEVSNDDILDELLLHCGNNADEDSSSQSHLLVGTGNSLLPRDLYDKLDGGATVTCLDYSLTCIKNLEMVHGDSCPNMKFIHGDATMLTDIFSHDIETPTGGSNNVLFNSVIDKGLIDALMCSEGWNGPVVNVLQGVTSVLKTNGIFMLISYKLPNPTKAFMEEISAEKLVWEFDLPRRSTDRVSFSIARRLE